MEQNRDTLPTESGLPRLLRRRRRIGRNQRRYGGKEITSWAEYSPAPLTVSGDGSQTNFWFYALAGVAAPMVPFLLWTIAWVASTHNESTPFWTRVGDFLPIAMMVLLPATVFALLLVAGTRIRIWLDRREALRRQARKGLDH